jgi:hypothetical protein
MTQIGQTEIQKRLAILRKIHAHRCEWFGVKISDQQMLRRREQGYFTLIFLFTIWIIQWGVQMWFVSAALVWPTRLFVVCLVVVFFGLCFALYRTRKILEVFEMFSPQNIEDLESAITTKCTEQVVPSDGHRPSNPIPTTGTTAPADAH